MSTISKQVKVTKEMLQNLVSTDGTNVLDLTKKGKVLLIFLRIFACPYCRKDINDVSEIVNSLRQLNINVVFIHQGPEEMARDVFNTYGKNLIRSHENNNNNNNNNNIKEEEEGKNSHLFPFYEIVDTDRVHYKAFELPCFDWNDFQKKERSTWTKAIDRWGTSEWIGEVLQLGAVFVINQDGSVFSSMLQKGQTNVHNLSELIQIPMDVRFDRNHSKHIVYRVQSAQNTEENKRVTIQEHYKEYREIGLKSISDQKIYQQKKKKMEQNENENNNENTAKNETTISEKLAQPFLKPSKLQQLLQCLPRNETERNFTEEELKQVIKRWSVDSVLGDESLRQFLRVFLTKELSLENLLFFEDLEKMNEFLNEKINQFENTKELSKEITEEITEKVKNLIDEYLLGSSINMVNVTDNVRKQFEPFTDPENVKFSNLDTLKESISKAKNEISMNLTDPLQRFRWSIEGQRAASFVLSN